MCQIIGKKLALSYVFVQHIRIGRHRESGCEETHDNVCERFPHNIYDQPPGNNQSVHITLRLLELEAKCYSAMNSFGRAEIQVAVIGKGYIHVEDRKIQAESS